MATRTRTLTETTRRATPRGGAAQSSSDALNKFKAKLVTENVFNRDEKKQLNAATTPDELVNLVTSLFKTKQQNAISELEATIQREKDQVEQLVATNNMLNAQKDNFDKERKQALEDLRSELQKKYEDLGKTERQKAKFNQQMLEDQIATLQREGALLSGETERLRTEITTAKKSAENLEARIQSRDSEIRAREADIEEANERLKETKDKFSQQNESLNEAKQSLARTTNELRIAEASAARAVREKDQKIVELQAAQASLKELKSQTSAQASEIAAAEKELKKRGQELESVTALLKNAEAQVVNAETLAAKAAELEIESELRKAKEIELEIAKANLISARKATVDSEFEAVILKSNESRLRAETQKSQRRLREALENQRQQRQDVFNLEEDLRTLSKTNAKYEKTISEKSAQIAKLQKDFEAQSNEFEKLTKECEDIRLQKDNAEKKERMCNDNLLKAETEIGALKTAVTNAELQVDVLVSGESAATTKAAQCENAIAEFFDSVEAAMAAQDTKIFRKALQKVQSAQNTSRRTVPVSEISDWFLLCVLFGPTKIAVQNYPRNAIRTRLKKLSGPDVEAALKQRVLHFGNVDVERVDPIEEVDSDEEWNNFVLGRSGQNKDLVIESDKKSFNQAPSEDEASSSGSEFGQDELFSPPASPSPTQSRKFNFLNPSDEAFSSRSPRQSSSANALNSNPIPPQPSRSSKPREPSAGRAPVLSTRPSASRVNDTPATPPRTRSPSAKQVQQSREPKPTTSIDEDAGIKSGEASDDDTALGYYENSVASVIGNALLQIKEKIPSIELPSFTSTETAPPKPPSIKATAYIQFEKNALLKKFVDWPSSIFTFKRYLDATLQTIDSRITVSDSAYNQLNIASLVDNTKKFTLQAGVSPWPLNLDSADQYIVKARLGLDNVATTTVVVDANGLSERLLWSNLATISYGIFQKMKPGNVFDFVVQVRLREPEFPRGRGRSRQKTNRTGVKAASRNLIGQKLQAFFEENELTGGLLPLSKLKGDYTLLQSGRLRVVAANDGKTWLYSEGMAMQNHPRAATLASSTFFWRWTKNDFLNTIYTHKHPDWKQWEKQWRRNPLSISNPRNDAEPSPEWAIEVILPEKLLGPNYREILRKTWPEPSTPSARRYWKKIADYHY